MELRGKRALVTGAAGGLGGYIARALAAEGVDLALSDLPAARVEGLVEELRPRGVAVEWVAADLTATTGLEKLLDDVEEVLGPLDILVNNAGVEFGGPFEVQTRDELETTTSVNVLAVMELTRLAVPRMLDRGGGHVVNLGSLAGKVPTPYLASYSATKHAVVGFTHALSAEYRDRPVNFSAICPGFISRVGMYGRVEDKVGDPPPELAPMPPEAVGEAVVRAIRDERFEVIVNRRPAKPLALLSAVAPKTATRLLGNRRVAEFTRRFAAARGRS